MAPNRVIILTAAWHIFFLSSLTSAHMRMTQPVPLNGDHDENKNPLGSGNPYPCQGYISSYPFKASAKYEAGSDQTIMLEGSATHAGGSCQISLSYDNGTSFRVIESMIGGCTLDKSLDFTVPENVPTGGALLSWTWFNKMGNREMYQNCAWVSINAASTPQIRAEPHKHKRSEVDHRRSQNANNIIRLDTQGQPAYFPPVPAGPSLAVKKRHHSHQRRHGRQHRHQHRHRRHLHPRAAYPDAAPPAPAQPAITTLPLIFKANIPQSNLRTDDGCDVIFPHPGPVVKHGQSQYAWCGNPSTGFTRLASAEGDGTDSGDGDQAPAPATSTQSAATSPLPEQASITFDLSTQTGEPWPFAGTAGTGNPTFPTTSPLYPNTTTTSTTQTSSTTPTSMTSPADPTQPTTPPTVPGRQDPCTDFGSWRCDQGGYRLERCNYAPDWVYSHALAWANMGVPTGTRCVLDAMGEPSFVFDT